MTLKTLLATLFVAMFLILVETESAEAQTVDQVVAQGYSIECVQDSANAYCFLPRYSLWHYQPATGKPLQVVSFAEPGQKVSQLRARLTLYSGYYAYYHNLAEVLVLDMGAGDYLGDVRPAIAYGCNDACVQAKANAFAVDYEFVFDKMYAEKGANTHFVPISMYQFLVEEDKFLDSDNDGESNFEEGRKFYQAINAVIKNKAATKNVQVVNLYEAFNGPTGRETTPYSLGYVSSDHIHPDADGAAEIARLVAATGYNPN